MITLEQVEKIAREAHEGQTDKIGVPYFQHVRAVADGVAQFGEEMEMAALLHDIVEDTPWTLEQLRAAGVPENVRAIVYLLTNRDGEDYQDKMREIVRNRGALLVKIADNAHNSRADRAAHLPVAKRERLAKKYEKARETLWAAAHPRDLKRVVSVVNPELLSDGTRSARYWVHFRVCPSESCWIDTGDVAPDRRCRELDSLLDRVEDEQRVKSVKALLELHMDAVLTHGAQVGQGLALAVKTLDPNGTVTSP